MKTGKQVWNQKFADASEGYYATSAPIVANGVLISGMAGGESTTRGFLDGWDPETGRKLWRTLHDSGARANPVRRPGPRTATRGRSAADRPGAPAPYDPELDLVYWGVGNAEPYDPRPRGALDSLYTSSVIAIRPKTGEIVCHFQYTPNDVYDVDGNDEQVLADLRVNGRLRKMMIQANKNGFLYVLDRTNCTLIAAHPFVKVNWASHIDLSNGPAGADRRLQALPRRRRGGDLAVARHQRRADRVQSQQPASSTPAPGTLPRIQKLAPAQPQVTGGNTTGVTSRLPDVTPGDPYGHLVADRSADRREEMGRAADRPSEFVRACS